MTLQARRTWRLLGGLVRVTVTHRGVGLSVGAGPLRWSFGADGRVRRTVRVAPGVRDTRSLGRWRP